MSAPPRPWTDADTARLRELHAAGATLNACAKTMRRSRATISKYAARAGLTWDRTRTHAATQAKVIDAKARRRAILDRLYTRAETVLGRLEANTFTTLVMSAGSQVTETLTFVPPQDERHLSSSVATYLTSVERLEKLDADHGVEQARGMLDQIGRAITAAAEQLGNPDPDDPNG